LISLEDLNGKMVLLEFCFPNCKGYVEIIEESDDIKNKYTNQGLLAYGI